MADKVRADMILRALSRRHTEDVFLTEVKTGATWSNPALLKIDGLAIKKSWSKPSIVGYEIKVARGDFLRDDKWPGYRDYCHRLYFACPAGIIQPGELADDVGLVTYNPETGGLHTAKAALFRDIELPWAMFYHLVISHLKSDRHPFFSGTREMLEAWVQDRKKRRHFGHTVRSAMLQTIQEQEEELEKLRAEVERTQRDAEVGQKARKVLIAAGVYNHYGDWTEPLRQRLMGQMPQQAQRALQEIRQRAEDLLRQMGEGA